MEDSIITALISFRMAIMVAAYVVGAGLCVGSIFKAHDWSIGQAKWITPLMMFFAGILLFYLPTVLDTYTETAFGSGHPLAWIDPRTSQGLGDQAGVRILMFVQVVGLAALFRSVLMMSKYGTQHAPPGLTAQVFWSAIGGLLAVNIEQSLPLLAETFGIQEWVQMVGINLDALGAR